MSNFYNLKALEQNQLKTSVLVCTMHPRKLIQIIHGKRILLRNFFNAQLLENIVFKRTCQ